MRLINSILFTLLYLNFIRSFDNTKLEDNIQDYIPKLNTEDEFQAWEKDLNRAAETVQSNGMKTNETSSGNKIVKVLSAFFVNGNKFMACKACKVGVKAFNKITRVKWTIKIIISSIDIMCRKSQKQPKSVCDGIAHSTGSLLFKILRVIDTRNKLVPAMACYAFGNICPMPSISLKKLEFPKKTNNKSLLKRSMRYKYILHISDLHYDGEYKEGAEADCSKPICCQADSNTDEKKYQGIRKPASKWGEYTCDANNVMLNSLLNKAAELNKELKYDMVLFTGDLPAHDMWKESVSRSEHTEAEAYKMISSHFPPKTNNLYPVIGNHESIPLNQFPFDGEIDSKDFYLYTFIADQWKKWLPKQSLDSVSSGGFYSVQHSKNLKVLVLNNNLFYTLNFYSLLEPSNPDPNGMFKWMINELQDAENRGSRVYITSHVSPGSTDFYQHWSETYHSIIERYSHIISGQFYGHLHTDQFEISYSGNKKNAQSAISTSYLAPSMSTMDGINPSFRVYKVDADTYEVIDFTQYYADLKQKSTWKKDANWQVMYTARQAYGFGTNSTAFPTLNGAFWHRATEFMASDSTNFDRFYQLLNGRGKKRVLCSSECQKRFICTLRAGRSKDNCAEVSPFS